MDMGGGFWFGVNLENLLIYGIDTTSWKGILATCIVSAFIAFLYEAMRGIRDALTSKCRKTATIVNGNGLKIVETCRAGWQLHLTQTILHFFHLSIGYILMLLIMTYNGYLAISLLLGAAVGYFVSSFVLWPSEMLLNANQGSCLVHRQEEVGSLLSNEEATDDLNGANCGTSVVPVVIHQEAKVVVI